MELPAPIAPAAGPDKRPSISTVPKQNPISTQKVLWPKFWSRVILTLSIFLFRAWFLAQIVEESLLYNPRWKSGSKRKYWQSYDNSRPLNLPPHFLCWRRVLLRSGWKICKFSRTRELSSWPVGNWRIAPARWLRAGFRKFSGGNPCIAARAGLTIYPPWIQIKDVARSIAT